MDLIVKRAPKKQVESPPEEVVWLKKSFESIENVNESLKFGSKSNVSTDNRFWKTIGHNLFET